MLKRPRYLLIGLGSLAIATAGILLAIGAYYEYKRDLGTLQKQLEAQTILLAEHAESSFSAAELMLTEIESEVQTRGLEGYTQNAVLWGPMYRTMLRSPQIGGLIMADADGKTIFVANKLPLANSSDLSGYDFFRSHREGNDLHIGAPLAVRDNDDALIPVSARLQDAEGRFIGVVAVLLDAAYFERFYSRARRDLDLRIGMLRLDGAPLIFYPAPNSKPSKAMKERIQQIVSRQDAESTILISPLDHARKIVALRQLSLYPVVLSIAYDYQAFMAALQPTFIRYGMIFMVLSFGIVIAIYVLDRSIRSTARSRDKQLVTLRKQQETEQLCNAIARNIPNGSVAVIDHELRLVFVDGQLWRNGLEKLIQARIGHPIYSGFDKATRDRLETLGRRALAGHKAEIELPLNDDIYRITAVPLPDDQGHIRRALALSQDITSLRNDQKRLEELNRQLHILSSRDEMLGVANRREFDRMLDQEWRRCAREQLPLGLLMIDVDYFKRFNDAYGHPAGDVCLQQVAAVLREAATRPADLVARYGGEELSILLPGADLQGTLHVAGRVHMALAERGVPFADSPVSDHVTVSIGAASLHPRHDETSTTLLKQADRALYQAKHDGRNRTVSAAG
ncbi:diguanylate cyclase [Halomonas shantousis]